MAPIPLRLLRLSLALAVVAVGARLAAAPDGEQRIDLPAVAAPALAPEPGRAPPPDDHRRSVSFARVIDCSPAIEEIGDTIVRQMRRSQLVERHGNRLCLVLTDEVPVRTAAVPRPWRGHAVR